MAYIPGAGASIAAAPATGGLSLLSLLGPLLLSFGPGILSKLLGNDPQAQLRDQIAKLTDPNYVSHLTNQFYQQGLQSPAFAKAQGDIATGANQSAGAVASKLGAAGIGNTGTGAILSSLGPSLIGSQLAGVHKNLYDTASSQAMDSIRERIAQLTSPGNTGASPNQQFLGAGVTNFSPFLTQFLKSKYPGVFPNGQTQTPGQTPTAGLGSPTAQAPVTGDASYLSNPFGFGGSLPQRTSGPQLNPQAY